jgi:Transposase IS66 family/IS66 C-terminal element
MGAWNSVVNAFCRRLAREHRSYALLYSLNRWEALCRYRDDGRLEIDNLAAERALRGPGLGRKNMLFFGSDAGGDRAAGFYSLVESAKLNGLDPEAYLRYIFERISSHPRSHRGAPTMARHRRTGATASKSGLNPRSESCGALQALMNDGGQVTLGAMGSIPAFAPAMTPKGMLVGLMRRNGESWTQLLVRLDATVVQAVIEDRIINDIHR